LWSDLNRLIYQTAQIYPTWVFVFLTIFLLFTPFCYHLCIFFLLKLFSLKISQNYFYSMLCVYLFSFIIYLFTGALLYCFIFLFYLLHYFFISCCFISYHFSVYLGFNVINFLCFYFLSFTSCKTLECI